MPTDAPIPVTLVSGFLGAGKTTLIQRMLSARPDLKFAVIENEFGAASIDHALLAHEAEVVEINDGCVCCSVRGDLIRILGDLARQRDAGAARFDHVLIETTGLADPAPVIQTFFVDPLIHARYRLDAMLVVIDAEYGMTQLDGHAAAREQVAYADALLVGKRDRTSDAAASALLQRLARINPRAPAYTMTHANIDVARLLDLKAFNLSTLLQLDPDFLHDSHAHHHDDITAFVYRNARAFDEARLEDFMARMIAEHHRKLLRYKGILNLAGESERVALQGVHMTVYGDRIGPWPKDAPRASTLVFIGRQLPEAALRAGLDACLI